MATVPAVGIDLGAINSYIAVYQNGKVEIITDDHGNRITPSCVAFTDTEQFVGDFAKQQTTINPRNTIFNFKGLIGHFYGFRIQNDIKHKLFKVISDKGKLKIQVEYKRHIETFYPEEISAMVLMKMKRLAEDYLKKTVTNAVITVPSYFNFLQQQSIKTAGTVAGFNVMRIVNEPTAAGVAYALQEKIMGEKIVLILDLGGTGCNVSVLAIEDALCEVIATFGEHVGGEDFNERLFNHLTLEFKNRYRKDLTSSERAVCRLQSACERAKCMLSYSSFASIEIDNLYEDLDFYTSVNRVQFEKLNADLFSSIIQVVEKTLQEAVINKTQIDEVVLVGGSARIPKVQQLLQEFFSGKKLSQSINKDEAVACGAAIQAAKLNGDHSIEIQDMLLLDVTPFSLGIETASGAMAPVIKRNTTIPAAQTESFTDYCNDRNKFFIKVYEGESVVAENNYLLGKFELTSISPAPNGAPEIDVRFSVCANNYLTVIVTEKSTNKTMTFVVTDVSYYFSKEDVKYMTENVKKYGSKK